MTPDKSRRFAGTGLWRRQGILVKPSAAGVPYLLDFSDATFVRSSEAAAVDPRDGWAFYDTVAPWPGTNVPRILEDGSILLEDARTNLVPNSENISAWPTLGSPTLTGGQDAPDGASDAYFVEDPGSGANAVRRVGLAVSTSVPYSHTAYLGKSDPPPSYPVFRILGNTGLDPRMSINPADGDHNMLTAGADTSFIWDVDSGFWRVAIVKTTDASETDEDMYFYPAWDEDFSGSLDTNAAGGHIFWGAQMELGIHPTSPIRTSGGSATRAIDQCTFATGDVPAEMKSGVFSVEVTPEFSDQDVIDDGIDRVIFAFNTGSTNRLYFRRAGSDCVISVAQSGVKLTSGAITFSRCQTLTLTFDSVAGSVTVAGATTGDGTTVGTTWTMPAGTLYVGNRESFTLPFSGVIGRPFL